MADNKPCLNCGFAMEAGSSYCPHCGQKANIKLLSVKALFGQFWSFLFNIDNAFFKTLRHIHKPWYLTEQYILGRRVEFLNPIRLFTITLLFHFGVLVSTINVDNANTSYVETTEEWIREDMYHQFCEALNKQSVNNEQYGVVSTIEKEVFPEHSDIYEDSLSFTTFSGNYSFSHEDIMFTSLDSITSKYKVTGFFDKIAIKQFIRMYRDRTTASKHFLSKIAWAVLLGLICTAGILFLLYIRRKIYFISHLVLMMQLHSFLFIVGAIVFYFYDVPFFTENDSTIMLIFLVFNSIYLYITMYKFYKQGILKTLIKFFITSFSYLFFIVLSLVVVVIISFFLF